VDRRETRAAQTAGLVGFHQGGLLFLGIAESAPAVGLQDSVVRSGHNPQRYDGYAMWPLESSDGASDYAYITDYAGLLRVGDPRSERCR
jgi:hypothetical protein